MEIQISIEDFKLIKSFYPEFKRKQIDTNDFIIGWSELMPVVEKIENLGIYTKIECNGINTTVNISHSISIWENPSTKIYKVHKAVIEFIKWYNEQPK